MPRLSLIAVMIVALLGLRSADAVPFGRVGKPKIRRPTNPIHLVAPIEQRLPPAARRNSRATGHFVVLATRAGGAIRPTAGTGFLVDPPDADGRALVLTNAHVIEGVAPGHGSFTVSDAAGVEHGGQMTRVVVQNHTYDYAVVEVQLEPGRGWDHVVLARRTPRPDEATYSVGFPYPGTLEPSYTRGATGRVFDRLRADDAAAQAAAASPVDQLEAKLRNIQATPKTIVLGRVGDSGFRRWALGVNGGVVVDQRSGPSGSGSPLFARADHTLVGLVFAGGDTRRPVTIAQPMATIVSHLESRLAELPASDRSRLRSILDRGR